MRAKASYTVREVAALSKESQSTVHRLREQGQLVLVPDSSPMRMTAESVHDYLRRLLDEGPQLPDGVARAVDSGGPDLSGTDDEARAALQQRVDELEGQASTLAEKVLELETQNESFRNTILVLRQSGNMLLDNLGEYTSPKIPNT